MIGSTLQPENWVETTTILVILAHPDDPEFFLGGSLARWINAGHIVDYLLLTEGDKGSQDLTQSPESIVKIRKQEQRKAADVLGVRDIIFLNEPDGFLQNSDHVRKQVVRIIRKIRPQIIVSSDPLTYYFRDIYINHPDHKMAGEITLSAVFPAVGNPFYFPELIREESLLPHTPNEIWLSMPSEANVTIDTTPENPQKVLALHEHASQIGSITEFDQYMLSRRVEGSTEVNPRFEEKFRRLFKR